jgi:hypothetical protein
MASDLTSGVLTLAGTVVGGAITFGGTYWTSHTQRQQVEQTRRDQVNGLRRQAWVTFLTKLDMFLDHTRELVVAMDGDVGATQLEELHRRYLAEWLEFVPTNAAVEIAGPRSVADRAKVLKTAVGTFSDTVDSRYQSGKWGRGRERAWDAVKAARQAFLEATQKEHAA